MDSEGSMGHYLNFQVNGRQKSDLVFAIIKSAHSKTEPTLSHEAVHTAEVTTSNSRSTAEQIF